MAEAAVSMVLDQLAPLIREKFGQGIEYLFSNVKEGDLQDLSSKLETIHEVLADAERRGVTDPKVESWLDKLKDIAYEIEDALDEWKVEVMKQPLQESGDASESSSEPPLKKVCYSLNTLVSWFKQPLGSRSLALDIKRINQRLDSIAQEHENKYKFVPNLGRKRQDFERNESTSFVEVSEIQGREDDKKTLLSKLLSESSGEGENGVKIVSIVGTGGMGKTALAKFVFNSLEVKDHFDVKTWVCVSDPFDGKKVAKAIVEHLTGTPPNDSGFEALLQRINASILGKKFLLVLDDVWTEEVTVWEQIRVSLNSAAPGSKILVTTRNKKVAEIMDSTYIHPLEPLKDMYCWWILKRIAFRGRPEEKCKPLEKTGQEIAKRCKGLPLAAKTLGGVLRFKSSLPEWESVLRSEICNIREVENGIFPVLKLSYNELHPAVKRCFSYCAIFEKGEDIVVAELIRMWMAQGYLCSSENATDMEQLGRQYVEDLAMRSLFQDFRWDGDDGRWKCKMHDFMHEFAQSLTKNECLVVPQTNGREKMVRSKDARHVNAKNTIGEVPDALFPVCDVKRIRSLLLEDFFPSPDGYHISPNLFSHLKRVRLLKLRYCGLQYIPEEIGNLIHIRYLDISGNGDLAELPETICDLYNLETFGMRRCSSLTQFPQGILKLINLRYLTNFGVSLDFKFPQGFERLENLRILDQFCATRSSGNQLGWLQDWNQLDRSLKIVIDDSVDEVEAKKVHLKNKKLLGQLRLEFLDIVRLEVLEALQPHPSLDSLELIVPGLHLLPKWIPTLTNLTILDLQYFSLTNPGLEDLLPLLETLTSLERLSLKELKMERVGREILSIPFSRLKRLEFWGCTRWEEWEDISSSEEEEDNDTTSISFLPSLQVLRILGCPELKAVPHRLLRKAKSLERLEISDCEHLRNRYNRESGQDWDKISHIPDARI